MSQIQHFMKLTKGIKLRIIKHQLNNLVYLFKYKYNYILYKLHIYKLYSYSDRIENSVDLPFNLKPQYVCTKHISALVQMRVIEEDNLHQEYFYTERNGVNKRKFVVVDECETNLKLVASLSPDKIGFRINEKEPFYFSQLPVLKVAELEKDCPVPFSMSLDPKLDRPKYVTKEIDLKYLRDIRRQRCLYDVASNHLLEWDYQNFYNNMSKEIEDFIKEIPFSKYIKTR